MLSGQVSTKCLYQGADVNRTGKSQHQSGVEASLNNIDIGGLVDKDLQMVHVVVICINFSYQMFWAHPSKLGV